MGSFSDSDDDTDNHDSKRGPGLSRLLDNQNILDSSTVLNLLGKKRRKKLADSDSDSELELSLPLSSMTNSNGRSVSNEIGFRQIITSSSSSNQTQASSSSNQAQAHSVFVEKPIHVHSQRKVDKGKDEQYLEQSGTKRSKMCIGDLFEKSKSISPSKSIFDISSNIRSGEGGGPASSSKIFCKVDSNKKTSSASNDDDDWWMMDGDTEVDKSGGAIKNGDEKEIKAKKGRSGKKKTDGGGNDNKFSKDIMFYDLRKDTANSSREINQGIVVETEYDEIYNEDVIHPDFVWDAKQSEEPLLLHDYDVKSQVNKFAAKFLLDHQVSGVGWLWGKYCKSQGAILGKILKINTYIYV